MNIRKRPFEQEYYFLTSRSGGPGGQHVNKVETSVELRFNLYNSSLLTEEEKERIAQKLSNKMTKEGELIVTAQNKRSQVLNKEEAVEKFYTILEKALQKPKKRRRTKPTKASKEKRIQQKKQRGEKKSKRKPPEVP